MLPAKRHRYTLDLKQRVIHQRFVLQRKPKTIAQDLDMPLRVVQRVLTTYRHHGIAGRNNPGRSRAMSSEQVEVRHPLAAHLCE